MSRFQVAESMPPAKLFGSKAGCDTRASTSPLRSRVMERTKKYGHRAALIQRDSSAAAAMFSAEELSFVYIDADHSYAGVMSDILAWHDKVKCRGGVMAFHDYLNPSYGVKKAVDEWTRKSGTQVHLIIEDKQEDAGAFFYVN